MRYCLTPNESGFGQGLDIVEEKLTKYGLKKKEISKSMLATEEVMKALAERAENAKQMNLSVKRVLDEIYIEIAIEGEEFDFESSLSIGGDVDAADIGPDTERAIRSTILRSLVNELKYRHRHGTNTVRISVLKSRHAMLYRTLGAILLAIVVGIILRLAEFEEFNELLDVNLLVPGKTIFMNALKMIVAPVVFFSIVSCISQFSDFSEMGKLGGRITVMYLFTTLIAVSVGVGAFYLFQPGSFGSVATTVGNVSSPALNVSFKDMIVGVVPDNFLSPFVSSNMLQLIFLALLCGIGVGMIGKYSKPLSELFSAFNELFLKITSLIVKFMPIAAFCSILSMVLTTGADALMSILSVFAVFIIALVVMMAVYCLIMLIFAGLNPLIFLRHYAPTMLQVFSIASSSAALPLNMDSCKKLGVPPKVYSLSLPLGATINMDGTCVYLSVVALSLARLYGVEISSAALLSVVISIIVLSVGAPGIPGSGLVCLSVLLAQLNVPVEAVALVMGIDPLIGMLRCMSNCLGDVAVSCVVSKKEKLLDMNMYKKGHKDSSIAGNDNQ